MHDAERSRLSSSCGQSSHQTYIVHSISRGMLG
jgi:hypothetical protein